MDPLHEIWLELRRYLPLAIAVAATAAALTASHLLLIRLARRSGKAPGPLRHLLMLAITAAGLLVIVLSLPISPELRDRLLGLLGLAFTAVVAFSSTTFVSNLMAGLMLRAMGNFRPGDFLRVGEHFGKVTERGLFHTEIQTEHRDLATLPNLYLVTQPVTVVRESGTIVQTTLSLGYDVPHSRIEELLSQAAAEAGLADPFVHVLELGDFSVSYRISGFLADVKYLLSARSRLRTSVLDALHGADIEIVSPNYMVQRRLSEGARVLPPVHRASGAVEAPTAEEIVFDKADAAASLEALRGEREALLREIEELRKELDSAAEADKARLEAQIESRRARSEVITAKLEQQSSE